MNQIYRALHMPPKRLIKKLSGQKEIYTIAVRRAPKGEGCDPLPALGEEPYTPLPYTPGIEKGRYFANCFYGENRISEV